MNGEILKAVLEEASALVAPLPTSIQRVAFAKAFDALMEERTATLQQPQQRGHRQSQSRISSGTLGGRNARSQRVGPKLALGHLLDSGYFASSRSLPEIQRHLRDAQGHDYESNELSISLLRLIRDGRLSRQRNLAGQYEYWAENQKDHPLAAHTPRQERNARLLTDGREQ
jgi:hypothetical protein